MPNYAIKSSGIRQVAANSLIGNSGSTGPAEELSATDAKTLLGLGTTDSPTFAAATIGNMTLSDVGSYDSITSGDARLALRAQDGSMELYMHNKSDGHDSFRFNTFNGIFELFSDADNQIDLRNGTSPNALNVFNTWTDASNYERGFAKWDSSIFQIGTEAAGTGVVRPLHFETASLSSYAKGSATNIDSDLKMFGKGTGAARLWLRGGTSGPNRIFSTDIVTTASKRQLDICTATIPVLSIMTTRSVDVTSQNDSSSGTDYSLQIASTINQTGTAGSTDLLISRTETAVGSGDQNLMDLQVGGTSKFKVDNTGNAVMSGVVNQMTSSESLPSTTEFPNDQDWGIHHDTANDHIYLAFNKSGSIKKTLIN
jgi:hypothetical protein